MCGDDILAQAPKPLQEYFIQRFDGMEDWEQSQMVSTMQRIAKMMDAEALDAAPMLEVGTIQKAE